MISSSNGVMYGVLCGNCGVSGPLLKVEEPFSEKDRKDCMWMVALYWNLLPRSAEAINLIKYDAEQDPVPDDDYTL